MTKKSDEVATKRDLEELYSDVADLIDKRFERIINEMHNIVDPVMKEIETSRQEQTILSGKVYQDHEPRITVLEGRYKS